MSDKPLVQILIIRVYIEIYIYLLLYYIQLNTKLYDTNYIVIFYLYRKREDHRAIRNKDCCRFIVVT